MTRRTRMILIVVGAAIGLPILAFGIYLIVNIQGVIEPFEVNAPDCSRKVLVASQGSSYKDALLERLVDHVKGKDIYLKVVDTTTLDAEDPAKFDAVIMVAAIYAASIPGAARGFIEKVRHPEKVIPIVTSDSGDAPGEAKDLDAITSASDVGTLDDDFAAILARLERAFGPKK